MWVQEENPADPAVQGAQSHSSHARGPDLYRPPAQQEGKTRQTLPYRTAGSGSMSWIHYMNPHAMDSCNEFTMIIYDGYSRPVTTEKNKFSPSKLWRWRNDFGWVVWPDVWSDVCTENHPGGFEWVQECDRGQEHQVKWAIALGQQHPDHHSRDNQRSRVWGTLHLTHKEENCVLFLS